jgi:Ohr subfamily peroxiredoxin
MIQMKVAYTTSAYSTGGRSGHVRVDGTPIDFDMAPPGGNREGVNPEQLFAAGYSACFGSALQHVIRVRKLNIPAPDVQITIGLGQDDAGNYELEADIVAIVDTDDAALADSLAQEAHTVCPYSRATSGNITVTVKGRPR